MAQYDELPVYKATYDLLLAIFQFKKGDNRAANTYLPGKFTLSKDRNIANSPRTNRGNQIINQRYKEIECCRINCRIVAQNAKNLGARLSGASHSLSRGTQEIFA